MGNANLEVDRKYVARLIYLVLAESMHVREAITKFPKDTNDPSIKAAYHALVHFEADEALRMQDLSYKDEQDDYLEFIAQTLQSASPLPKNLIKSYDKYYKDASVPHSGNMKGILKSLCKFLNV